jgi:hypothetical protein
MERYRTARNVAIVFVLGAAIYYVPGGGRFANAFTAALWALFGIGFGYLGLRYYRERQFQLAALGDRHRGMLYGAVALAVFLYMAKGRMWETSLGELAWFLLAGGVLYAAMEIYRHYRSYA